MPKTMPKTMPKSYNSQVSWQQDAIIRHNQLLLHSFQHWTGYALIDTNDSPILVAQRLFKAPLVVVSHGTESEPIFNYGNQKALELWQLDWEAFTNLPSRCSAEPMEQKEREHMLAQAKNQGFISKYRGIRIKSTGERFKIEDSNLPDGFQENSLLTRPAGMEICFVEEDVSNAFLCAVEAGAVAVVEPKVKPWGQTIAYVRDLNGTLVEIASPM